MGWGMWKRLLDWLAGSIFFFFYVDGAKLTTVQYQPSILLVVFCNGALFYNKKYF